MTKKFNVALFGLGKFGKNYARLLSEMKDGVEFRAVVTSSSDPSIVFNDQTIDSVIIVTPPSTHFELIKKSLESGKNVLVEKPMVLSIKEAEDLKGIVSKSGKVFMVGYQYVYNDYIKEIKKSLGNNIGGEVKYMMMEHYLSQEREDVDVFLDAAPHPLSIFEYIFSPTEIIEARGIMNKDFVSVMVKFDKDPLLQITSSWRGEKKVRTLRIIRESSLVTFDDALLENKLKYIDASGVITSSKIKANEPLKNEIKHFIECVRGNETPTTNFDFGYKITEWSEEISNRLK